jgi:hypothetical protein
MRTTLKLVIGIGALGLASLLVTATRAQGPSAFYYPSAGSYATTAGTVYIPAPGYYYNVPARVAAPAYAVPPRTGPTAPSYTTPGLVGRPRSSNPPYYSSAVHSLHGRGIDSSRHGR